MVIRHFLHVLPNLPSKFFYISDASEMTTSLLVNLHGARLRVGLFSFSMVTKNKF